LIVSIRQLGVMNILRTIQRLNGKIVFVLIFPVTWNFLQSWAWFQILASFKGVFSFKSLFLVRIAGIAVSILAPIGIFAGDSYRIFILNKTLSGSVSVASVIIDRTLQTVAILFLFSVSVVAVWFSLPLSPRWQVILFFSLFLLAFGIFRQLLWQKKGLLSSILGFIQKTGFFRFQYLSSRIEETDRLISSFYQKKLYFLKTIICHLAGRFLGVVEIYFIAYLIGCPLTFSQALFLTMIDIIVNSVFVFVPANLGVMEGGFGVSFYLLNLNPSDGMAIQLIRRIRQLVWTFFGLLAVKCYPSGFSN